jgi:hypothetical protein
MSSFNDVFVGIYSNIEISIYYNLDKKLLHVLKCDHYNDIFVKNDQ